MRIQPRMRSSRTELLSSTKGGPWWNILAMTIHQDRTSRHRQVDARSQRAETRDAQAFQHEQPCCPPELCSHRSDARPLPLHLDAHSTAACKFKIDRWP